MAVYGLACVFLYIVPAIVFLLPTSLVSAELASGWSGGVYRWVAEGLSKLLGFLAVWCQFAMTIFYYPACWPSWRSTIAYVIDPALAANGVYTAIVIMVLYWTGVWVSSRGTKALARALLVGPGHRHARAGHRTRRPRPGLPRPGQPVGRADGQQPSAAPVDGPGKPRPHRQQLPLILRHGNERRARVLAQGPGEGSTRSRCSWRWGWCW